MMSSILYLSLRWYYEVGSCTIVISVMTAIKWYLFCYRLDFSQKSLNHTVANAQSTVHWTLLIEWRLASYISVYDGRMKLGVAPLRSVWLQLSNDIDFNQKLLNYTVANAQSTVHWILLTVMIYILHLSLRWSYEVGSCTIAICVMTAIKWYLFCYRLHFNQKSLNHRVANVQSTVHCTLLTECLTTYISVYDGRMKLGVVPLQSVWWQLSNDVYFAIDDILTRSL